MCDEEEIRAACDCRLLLATILLSNSDGALADKLSVCRIRIRISRISEWGGKRGERWPLIRGIVDISNSVFLEKSRFTGVTTVRIGFRGETAVKCDRHHCYDTSAQAIHALILSTRATRISSLSYTPASYTSG
jgi:hypothetical protein